MAAIDEITLSTLSLLESRLHRIEHLLYGQNATPSLANEESVALHMNDLEKRFSSLVANFRVYGELLKIYKSNPDFFHTPHPSEPPTQLSSEAIQSIVVASASSFHATVSSLNAIKDSPVPDPTDSAGLINLSGKMLAIESTQLAQAVEIAELRARSEVLIKTWYEGTILDASRELADVESRVEKAERRVRRVEHSREADEQI